MPKKIVSLLIALSIMLSASFAFVPEAYAAPKPTKVTIVGGASTLDLADGGKLQLSAEVLPADAGQEVTWKSSNTSVASIAQDGQITAKKIGSTTISVASKENTKVTAKFTLKVVDSARPEKIQLSTRSMTLVVEKQGQLSAKVMPETAAQDIVWRSSKTSVATVDENGNVTARKAGTATITAYSAARSAVKLTVRVTVKNKPAPSSIALAPSNKDVIKLNIGEKMQISAAPVPADANPNFKFKSSSSSKASVSSSGLVTAKKEGKITITVYSAASSKRKDTYKIQVVDPKAPEQISLSDREITLYVGANAQVTATPLPATANQSVKWTTSKSSVASVSASGVITAKKAGTATITAKSGYKSSVKATVKVKVVKLPAPTSIMITSQSPTVEKGKKVQLYAAPVPTLSNGAVKWSSSSTSVATVSSSGVVTAKKGGSVRITATSSANSKIKATYDLVVTDANMPTGITLSETGTLTLDVSQTYQLSAKFAPSAASQSAKWATSSSSIASISSSGLITAKKAGTATITVSSSSYSNIKTTLKVTVVNRAAPTSVSLSAPSKDIAVNDVAKLTVTTTPADASKVFTFKSSNTAVLGVNVNGEVQARKVGSAVVTATSKKKSSVKATFTFNVYDPVKPSRLSLSHTALSLGPDDTATLVSTVFPATAPSDVTWKSSNTSVATVSASGVVKGVNVGTATITCTTKTGSISSTATVSVMQTVLTTTIPDITTDVAGISKNLAKIEAVRRSAVNEVLKLQMASQITSSESSQRQAIINRAFDMQAFPWMTEKVQEYYNSAYAYKRYMPGTVYYGLPYIQHGTNKVYSNRQYDKTKAVSNGYFVSSGKGYYLMNHSKRLNGTYVGNDCSAFVSMSQFGTGAGSQSYANTTKIYSASYYKTVKDWKALRPGDLLVKSGTHTVLFLYYTNDAKTSMMCIHQGGSYSTIHCIINKSYTPENGYIARRQTSFK